MVKFCVNCKHCKLVTTPSGWVSKPVYQCARKDTTVLNLVTGKHDLIMVRDNCEAERSSYATSKCGVAARFFEEK